MPQIQGQPVALDEALSRAADLLAAAHVPLFGGLVTDVNGARAVMELADHRGALSDHMGGDALFRNLLVLQDGGWMTATLTEVRNRADLIVVVGNQCLQRFPRLVERVFLPPEALFSPPGQRTMVLLGPWDPPSVPTDIAAANPILIPVAHADLAGVCGLLRGLVAGRPVRADAIPGVSGQPLEDLARRLCAARYAVVTWSAAEFDFPHAELTIQGFVELVRDLNRTTRAAALPLAGTLGDVTVNQVCTWQTGYPLRSGRQQDRLRYEPALYRYQDLLARDQCDLLLWVQALPAATPGTVPATARPSNRTRLSGAHLRAGAGRLHSGGTARHRPPRPLVSQRRGLPVAAGPGPRGGPAVGGAGHRDAERAVTRASWIRNKIFVRK